MTTPEMMKKVNDQLAYLYSNGKGEAGLEVGIDAGLPLDQYIRIPRCMEKKWVVKIQQSTYNKITGQDITIKPWNSTSKVSDYLNEPGWWSSGMIRIVGKAKEVKLVFSGNRYWVPFVEYHMEPLTCDDMASFYTVNVDHINDIDVHDSHHMWVHAVRFWAVAGGLVTADKNTEWIVVDDPQSQDPRCGEFIGFASKFSANAWTACAARATSWKKTNHCTGGTPATGLPKRWMVKEGFWPSGNDVRKQMEINATSAFYVASHGVSVHAVLAQLASNDDHHWCLVNPAYGFIEEWDIGESVRVRMLPKDQVAGTAIVADSIVVLKMLVSEGLSPCLEFKSQIPALIQAHDVVKKKGMLCGVFRSWYFEGYPRPLEAVSFSQRDPSFFELVNELAIVASKFYSGSTIAQSMALQNLARQSNLESIKANWAAASTFRIEFAASDLINVIQQVRGLSSMNVVVKMSSNDIAERKVATDEFNYQLREVAGLLSIDNVKTIIIKPDKATTSGT